MIQRQVSFGYLPGKNLLEFDSVVIAPREDGDVARELFAAYSCRDGHYHPPLPRSSHLHRLPPTHRLFIKQDRAHAPARDPALFLIMALGYLCGRWLLPVPWWFDMRLPVRKQHNIVFDTVDAEEFISKAFQIWTSWSTESQERMIGTLMLLSRAPSYHWDWERFSIEYMVLDACWATASQELGCRAKGHADRAKVLCRKLGLQSNDTLIDSIVRARNDLIHEGVWDGGLPNRAVALDAYFYQYHLRRFNQRVIAAMLGRRSNYLGSIWWDIGSQRF